MKVSGQWGGAQYLRTLTRKSKPLTLLERRLLRAAVTDVLRDLTDLTLARSPYSEREGQQWCLVL